MERKGSFFSQKILCLPWRRQKQAGMVTCSLSIIALCHTSKKQPCRTGHLSHSKGWVRSLRRTGAKWQILLHLQSGCNGQDNFESLLTQAHITRQKYDNHLSVYSGGTLAIPRSAHVFSLWSTGMEDINHDLVYVKGLLWVRCPRRVPARCCSVASCSFLVATCHKKSNGKVRREREKAASEWRRNRQENFLEPAQSPLGLVFLCLHIHTSWQQTTLVLFKDGPSVVLGRMFGNDTQGGARNDVVRHSQQSLELFSLTSMWFVWNP